LPRMPDFIDTPASVRPGEELDCARLEPYLRAKLAECDGPLSIQQFPHGHSNLTYLVRVGAKEFVLRRPPFGNQVKSAHDMSREYHVLSRLAAVYPPAPKAYLLCEDISILGAPFYLMERRTGIILRRTLPPGLTFHPDLLRRMNESLVDNLATLH